MSGDRTGMTFNVKAGVFMNELEAKIERLEKAAAGFIALYEDVLGGPDNKYWPDQLRELKAALEEKGDG